MSNSQKFRICFNYLMGYTDFKPWINPTDAEFKTQTWPYQSAIYMFDNNLAGSCLWKFAKCSSSMCQGIGL